MALHRDIFWVGRQWAVTGHGLQAVDQKQKSKFDIEICRLWADDLTHELAAERWFNAEDFSKGLSIARARYPAPGETGEVEPPQPFRGRAHDVGRGSGDYDNSVVCASGTPSDDCPCR